MKPDSAHAEAAVRAYCRELCDPGSSEHAVTESLQRFKTAGSPDAVEDELLRITRTTVADQAHEGTGKGQDLSRPERKDTCARTMARLTASANHELQPGEGHKLEAHLCSCLPCQATELRVRRAKRAFTATLAGAGTVAALSETAQPGARAPISETAGFAAVARPETPVPQPERPPVTRPSREPSQPAPLRVRLLAVGGAMVTAGVVAAVLLLSGTSSDRGTAPFRHGSPTSFPSPAASAPTATTTPRTGTPANAGASTAPSPAPSAANPGATRATSPVVPSPSAPAKVTSTPAAPRASGSNPRASPNPAAPPTPTPPPRSPSSPSRTGMTMTQHGPSLSAVPAPTKGIGPGG